MKFTAALFATVSVSLCLTAAVSNAEDAFDLGFRTDTEIDPSPDDEICPGTDFLQNDDGSFENGYMWSFSGIQEPDYGSWAECYESGFVCGIQFLFTQTGYYLGQTMDVYVWESLAEGDPPPGPDPGNVICVLTDIAPGPIAFWPDISTHNIEVCCETDGAHFVGYWTNAPFGPDTWFIAVDEDGPGLGCPRTKVAPGIGLPTGWHHPNVIGPVFEECKDLGIREFAGLGDCEPSSVPDLDSDDHGRGGQTTWGQIKALY